MSSPVTSSERLWSALHASYYDDVSPGVVSSSEWEQRLKPAVEAKPDLDDDAVALLKTLSVWDLAELGARTAIQDWLGGESSKFRAPVAQKVSAAQAGKDALFATEKPSQGPATAVRVAETGKNNAVT